eukprot:2688950-Ditylum_brightwellii.AAC.1
MVKVHNIGSYDLKLVKDERISAIKKHGRDLYKSLQILGPFPHTRASDHQYGVLNKKITSNPYYNAGIDQFKETGPWGAPAAFADAENKPFPTTPQVDDEFDS